MPDRAEFAEFVADTEPTLRRALADGFGPEAGREATIDALAFAWSNWDRVTAAPDATAYLTQVGSTAAERHTVDLTGDVTPILPSNQSAFDTIVPPVSEEAAIARSSELTGAGGAPTVAVATGRRAATVAGRPVGRSTTKRLPVTPMPTGPSSRRAVVWIVVVVLLGIIALVGIAAANRSDNDELEVDPSLPTLPTTVPGEVSLPATLPPSTATTAAPVVATTTPPVTDTLPEITAPPDYDDDSSGDDDDSDSGDSGDSSDSDSTTGTTSDDDQSDSDGDTDGDSESTSGTTRSAATSPPPADADPPETAEETTPSTDDAPDNTVSEETSAP